MKLHHKALEIFNRWFCSATGVFQTLGLCVVVVVFEHFHPNSDPQGFQLLYWLTVYSAITQPMLAYVASKSASGTDKILNRIEDMCSDEFVMDTDTNRKVAEILEILRGS